MRWRLEMMEKAIRIFLSGTDVKNFDSDLDLLLTFLEQQIKMIREFKD
jgi:hypothetical protein